jgi:muramoyltetrapeptide carboxypeptidase LdcA involved in peptidoglycan recycling
VENDVSYTLDRWAEHRNSFLRNVDAILVGKVKLGKVGNSDQAFVADKLARALESLGVQGVPIIRTPLFGGKTCPAFLPIGGSVTLSITTEKATLTIPAHVR